MTGTNCFKHAGITLAFGLALFGWARGAWAASLLEHPKYAAILVDAKSGEILYSRRADEPRHPASITKVMTLYLTFEAIETGKLSLRDWVPISRYAAAQTPSKLGLRSGDRIMVEDAIRIIATKSANDLAVALAEKIAGTEGQFAELMTKRAHQLGMKHTRFVNASGLPNPNHSTTARDIATMSLALIRHFPQYYGYFRQQEAEYAGRVYPNHNHLLARMPEVDGIKTGYTVAAGFTLAASAIREGKRLVAVVLGGPSGRARDDNVADLLNAGFDVMKMRALGYRTTVAANLAEPDDVPELLMAPQIEQGSVDDEVTAGAAPKAAARTGSRKR